MFYTFQTKEKCSHRDWDRDHQTDSSNTEDFSSSFSFCQVFNGLIVIKHLNKQTRHTRHNSFLFYLQYKTIKHSFLCCERYLQMTIIQSLTVQLSLITKGAIVWCVIQLHIAGVVWHFWCSHSTGNRDYREMWMRYNNNNSQFLEWSQLCIWSLFRILSVGIWW
jgi:hypothetical protein